SKQPALQNPSHCPQQLALPGFPKIQNYEVAVPKKGNPTADECSRSEKNAKPKAAEEKGWGKQNEENACDESQGSHGQARPKTHGHRQAGTDVKIRIVAGPPRGNAAGVVPAVYSCVA